MINYWLEKYRCGLTMKLRKQMVRITEVMDHTNAVHTKVGRVVCLVWGISHSLQYLPIYSRVECIKRNTKVPAWKIYPKTYSIKKQNVMNAQYFNRHNNGDKITIWLLVDRQHDRQRLIWHYSYSYYHGVWFTIAYLIYDRKYNG